MASNNNFNENDTNLSLFGNDQWQSFINEFNLNTEIIDSKIKIKQTKSKIYSKWYTECKFYDVHLNFDSSDFITANKNVSLFFSKLCKTLVQDLNQDDKIRVIIFHNALDIYIPISIPFIDVKDFDADLLNNIFMNISQSKRNLKIDENLKIKTEIIRIPTGKGLEIDEFLESKRSILIIKNNDNLCLLRAIVIAKELIDNKKARANRLNNINNKLVNFNVKLLISNCNIDENEAQSISVIHIIEEYLKDYQITVYDSSYTYTNRPIYIGEKNLKFIYLYLNNKDKKIGHYNVIKSMKIFLNSSYFCDYCKTKYENKYRHQCDDICNICKMFNCEYESGYFECEHCSTKCKNDDCLKNHIKYTCMKQERCKLCNEIKYRNHVCQDDYKFCSNCNKQVDFNHKCYITKEEIKENNNIKGFIFFDYEALQEDGKHIANLIIAFVYNLNNELVSENIFRSNDAFCSWLFKQTYFIAIAHNMRAYDGMFILNYIFNNKTPNTSKAQILITGYKFLKIQYKNVTILDSYSFLAMPLSKFSSTFNLPETKGYFPHFFNKIENQNYIGSIPEKEYYGYNQFSSNERIKFLKWYEENKNTVFNFQDQLIKYCKLDVKLLSDGVLAFRKIIKEKTKIDPFFNTTTIASLSHLIYRQNYMPENKIALIPDFGYNPNRKSSIKAKLWLRYYSIKHNVNVIYSENGIEKSIGPYRLDGFYILDGVYYGLEFHGCFYHGCPKCYTPDTFNPILQSKMQKIFERHCNRINYIKSKIILIELWECEWESMLKNDLNLLNFVNNEIIEEPINARDALFGGRTNAFKLYHKCDKNESIKYIDYTSLYPFVQKYCDYPTGHPEIITTFKENTNVLDYYGLIKCIVLPPQNLRFPVLPARINNKLVFTLCNTCAVIKSNTCNHNEKERQLKGTWCSIELNEALKFNYKIIRLIEVWHFKEKTLYDKSTKSGGLFTNYMNHFLQMKQESSGWPSNITTEQEKLEYVQSYFENEGILLKKDEISANNGLRSIMKILLNALWGRFGMRSNKTKMKLITEPAEWFSFLSKNQYEIKFVNFSNDDIIQVFYCDNDSFHQSSNKCNVVIAAFVTAHARIKLFAEMNKLNDRLLYCDTDSLIYISRPDMYEPSLGDYLGQFKDETDGDPIIEFVSAGPKNRAHVTKSGKQECIVKGFTLNYLASLSVNFQSMKEIVLFSRDKKISVQQMKIIRNINDWTLDTIQTEKEYGLTYDKRILFDDLTTLPFGFK